MSIIANIRSPSSQLVAIKLRLYIQIPIEIIDYALISKCWSVTNRVKTIQVEISAREKVIMFVTLKILCILLKVLMLTRAVTAFYSEVQEDQENIFQDTPSFQFFTVNNYLLRLKKIYMQKYLSNVTEKNLTESILSKPTFPIRTFVEFENKLIKKNIFVTLRWDKPELTNEFVEIDCKIQYWSEDLNRTIQINIKDINTFTILEYKVYDLKPDTTYYFNIEMNNLFNSYVNFTNVSTTHENPIPLLLVNMLSKFSVDVLDVDLQIAIELDTGVMYEEIVYSALEYKIYGINNQSELITSDFNPTDIKTNRSYTKIAKLTYNAQNLCIDWIQRKLYWTQGNTTGIYIIKLDLTLWQQMGIVKYDEINIYKHEYKPKFFHVLPSTGYIYWYNNLKSEIMRSDLDGKNMKVLDKDNKCFCSELRYFYYSPTIFQIDTTNIEPLLYWKTRYDLVITDIDGCKCYRISEFRKKYNFIHVTFDKTNIYVFNEYKNKIYIFKKIHRFFENKEHEFEYVRTVHYRENSDYGIKTLISLDKTLQPYPQTKCLIPNIKDYRIQVLNKTVHTITISLPEPMLNDGCKKYKLPTTIYNISVSYLTCLDNVSNKFVQFNVVTHERHYEFKNLMPFTEYTLKLALSNFYFDKLSMNLQFGSDVKVMSAPDKIDAPKDVTVQVLMPTLAIVYWMPSKNLNCVTVTYEVHWMQYSNKTQEIIQKSPSFKKLVDKIEHTTNGKLFTTILLQSQQNYQIYVRVYPHNFSQFFNDSLNKTIYMSELNNLNLSGVSTISMNVSWISSVNLTIHTEFCPILEYKNNVMREWQIANNSDRKNNNITYYIKNLLPRTLYNFRLILRYPEYKRDFVWPDKGFNFETLGNVPSAPGIPMVIKLPNLTYQLNWEPAQAHDSPVILYRLEGVIVENNYEGSNQTGKHNHWNLYYNGTDNYCWITPIDINQKYRFRVQAKNVYGFGKWNETGADINLSESVEVSTIQYLIPYIYNFLPFILSLIATIVICYVYYFYCCKHRQRKKRKQIISSSIYAIELPAANETRYVSFEPNFVHDAKPQIDLDEFAPITIKKEQITVQNLLGSGAFGEVYQGSVEMLEMLKTIPVAIKMLPEHATSEQKYEFLKEAQIMKNFDHKHVLKLLGICLETNLPWLILELMEAGDLLTFLRESRTLQPSHPHALSLQDLLAMCEDVARGCRYLEEQRYVHRDLACRNCLISTKDREHRIVKISDFGLARDIYERNSYYMEGGTPLPVRWMAPESLKYKKFTSQSDVWAFGVLMWEITSLGQLPYVAIHNSKIKEHVCAGNKLSKPRNCPDKLYELMQSCWNIVNQRPSFKLCLENIETLKVEIQDAVLIPWNISRHIQLPSKKC
ncbi:proto-oncogene tyrosine-protein kinase ROS-like [Nylanderia fulva]|uniref:proto-oncogene tyrosine-protein kinase ROS-like n=1 Tax=Nylanderia fulva TaxID=613905 RepID=UPI0010FB0393|nr:proto-oncogene tyrosine-protein kinase ROS-like [Nylanderia fulva]